MNNNIEPLVNDGFAGEPVKRTLAYIQSKREQGKHVVGVYCSYAPLEIIRAMDAVPAVLCAFANKTVAAAEVDLPANLCPLIKSSYGFIITDTCPFFSMSEAVVAETTCDGKKKMFELIATHRPMFVMDLPQLPDEREAADNWTVMIKKLRTFLSTTFDIPIPDEKIEAEIKATNEKNRLINQIFDFAGRKPTTISWQEIYDLTFLAQPAFGRDIVPLLIESVAKLEERVKEGLFFGKSDSPRVLITGCPVGGDAMKVFRVIEEAGGVIVGIDNCTGMKTFADLIEEDTADPLAALSRRYLKIPCSCMTPNTRRLTEMDKMIKRFQPDVIIDVVLQACHAYNVESHKVKGHVTTNHGLPYLKIETDYSPGDVEQIRTRVEAMFEMI
ncbi:MAG: double-cubane-cluster-containing anaerobic reductase [Syntrophales bacterium]|nr:double-cubane-cluster-containing anaerobic reductase [Syntrophales bacterium]